MQICQFKYTEKKECVVFLAKKSPIVTAMNPYMRDCCGDPVKSLAFAIISKTSHRILNLTHTVAGLGVALHALQSSEVGAGDFAI